MTVTLDAAEVPLAERPDIEAWSENYCNQAYSPANGVGFWTHLSRLAGVGDVWRDVMIAYLPGDRFLLAKGYGNSSTDSGPGAGMLSMRCEEPWRRWSMRFRGAVRDVSGDDLRAGAIPDRHHHVATLDLTWNAMAPVWDLGARMSGQTWAHAHYEQACAVTGLLTLGDERWEIDGTGIRDHSRGSRVFGTVREHWWLNGQFPSGRSFAVLQVFNHGEDVTPLSSGYVSDGETLEDAEVLDVAILEADAHGAPLRTRCRLRTASGEHVLTGRILQSMPFGMGSPNELELGRAVSDATPLTLRECQTEYTWDGETAYGLTERSWTPVS
jgi:hypothetical protein